MAKTQIELPHHRYDVLVEPGSLTRLATVIPPSITLKRCALLADEHVYQLHGEKVEQSLTQTDCAVVSATFPAREEQKTLDVVRHLYDVLLEAKLERHSPVIALGGGVTGDIVGFVAATYLRGIPFIQCPTSLLAMVDASVGGKVGVNVPQGKNLIGSFYQPQAVIIDPLVLETLPARELRCGLAECVKHAMICDARLLHWIDDELDRIQGLDPEILTELVQQNVEIKAAVVSKDEKERGLRAILNFGHTFAHVIEQTTGFGIILHGEAVALGMIAATSIAVGRGTCPESALEKLVQLLKKIGLPTKTQLAPTNVLLEAMTRDKKVIEGRLRIILPKEIGQAEIVADVKAEELERAWHFIREHEV